MKSVRESAEKSGGNELLRREEICERHGSYVSQGTSYLGRVIYSICPDCMAERQRIIDEQMRLKEIDRRNERLQDAGVPLRFRTESFETFEPESPEQRKALEMCRKFCETCRTNRRNGAALFLIGSVGTGKSHLGLSVLIELLAEARFRGRYCSVMRMIREIRDSYRPGSTMGEQELIDHFTAYDLLVVDEVGVQLGTESEKLLLFEIINGRYENYRPTVLISNLNLRELTPYFGERSMDRLIQENGAIVPCVWESYRKSQREAS